MSNALIEEFESLLMSTKREGIERLIDFLRKSDFYTAPASSRYHSCHAGGLLEHSMNVYKCLKAKAENPLWKDAFANVGPESIIITALLHDLCKTNYYVTEMKNKKVYSETGKKLDSNGRYDWVSVPGYTVEDSCPYGHGEKSVMMAEAYILLKPVERFMIRWHMHFTEPKELYNTLSAAIEKYPAILAIGEADLEATYLLEERE